MNPHEGQPILRGGARAPGIRAALVLIHGRGANAADIFGFGTEVADGVEGIALLAPQAAGNTWYPQRFLVDPALNEPNLSSALNVISRIVADLGGEGVPPEKVILGGFSQGACLSLEFAVRNPRRYGGVIGLSGAIIGVPGSARTLSGSLGGTPVYLGCSDRDAHIPLESVEESFGVMKALGAEVTKHIFPGMGHTVNAREVAFVKDLVSAVAKGV